MLVGPDVLIVFPQGFLFFFFFFFVFVFSAFAFRDLLFFYFAFAFIYFHFGPLLVFICISKVAKEGLGVSYRTQGHIEI
jgi:hypothetical protein